MDDRRFNGFDDEKPKPSSGFDSYYSTEKPKKSDFKVSINDQSDDFTRTYPSANSAGSYRPAHSYTNSPADDSKFKVSIPEPRQARPRTNPQANRTGAKRTAKSSASAKSGAKKASSQKRSSTAQNGKPSSKRLMTPQQKAKMKELRKFNFIKRSLTFFTCLIFIAIITITASSVALATINDILAINKESGTTVSVVIEEGDKFDDVIDKLADNGLISQKLLVKMFCKFRHYDGYYSKKQDKYIELQYLPGVYYLESNSGVESMLETIRDSSSGSKETVRVTFPEGWTIAQIFQKIEKAGVCTAEKLYANLDIVGKQFDFYEKITSTSGRYLKAEGYLFPDTYDFYLNENANSVLKKLFTNFQDKWSSEYQDDAKKLGRSVDEIMTIASIIQREAKDKSQMAAISSVLHNRLADPSTYPQLQMNSTQDYITSLKEFKVFTDYYYSVYLDSYNTYSIEGLPPGAICNPGIDAIEAALHPAQTDYHFFCHDKQGVIYLAVTASEHKRNTEKVFYDN